MWLIFNFVYGEKKIIQFKYKTGNRMWNTSLYYIYNKNKFSVMVWWISIEPPITVKRKVDSQTNPIYSHFRHKTDKSWPGQTFGTRVSPSFDLFLFLVAKLELTDLERPDIATHPASYLDQNKVSCGAKHSLWLTRAGQCQMLDDDILSKTSIDGAQQGELPH